MEVPNGPGWSPDGGNYWAKDNVLYWHDGDITKLGPGIAVRLGFPGSNDNGEDYSAWTDEHRAEVKAKFAADRAEYKRKQEEEEAVNEKLVESAKAKLTEDEFDAVVALGYDR